jgi:hypothetical protein
MERCGSLHREDYTTNCMMWHGQTLLLGRLFNKVKKPENDAKTTKDEADTISEHRHMPCVREYGQGNPQSTQRSNMTWGNHTRCVAGDVRTQSYTLVHPSKEHEGEPRRQTWRNNFPVAIFQIGDHQ